MGGNGSYSKAYRGVPLASRTHIDTNMRIGGHKVLLQKKNVGQSKNILNSNSESPIYIIAASRKDGTVYVKSVNVFRNHELCIEINLKYDSDGNYIAFNGSASSSSHAHLWNANEEGYLDRKSHNHDNVHDIPREYDSLIRRIVEFNKQKRKWEE